MAEDAKDSSGPFKRAPDAIQDLPAAGYIDPADAIAAKLESLGDPLPLSESAIREIDAARREHANGETLSVKKFCGGEMTQKDAYGILALLGFAVSFLGLFATIPEVMLAMTSGGLTLGFVSAMLHFRSPRA